MTEKQKEITKSKKTDIRALFIRMTFVYLLGDAVKFYCIKK